MRVALTERATLFSGVVPDAALKVAAPTPDDHDSKLSPDQNAYWTLVPRPNDRVVADWMDMSLDQRFDAVLPSGHHHWSDEQKYRFVSRITGMLVEDMMTVFASHHERDQHGHLVFWKRDQQGDRVLDACGKPVFDPDDCADFLTTLGWVCGHWPGIVPFDFAMRLFGFDPRVIREATTESYEQDLHLVEEVRLFGAMADKIMDTIVPTNSRRRHKLRSELADIHDKWGGVLPFDVIMRIYGVDDDTRRKLAAPRGPLFTKAPTPMGQGIH